MDVNLQTDIIVATRSVATEIVDYADKLNVDLIIVGTRGRGGLKRMLLGSVASEVREICRLSCTNSKVSKRSYR